MILYKIISVNVPAPVKTRPAPNTDRALLNFAHFSIPAFFERMLILAKARPKGRGHPLLADGRNLSEPVLAKPTGELFRRRVPEGPLAALL
jgi:hypothetical protein